ncbi:MAG: hypothetical protein AABZ47_16485 [Planctomycetota bacterium]
MATKSWGLAARLMVLAGLTLLPSCDRSVLPMDEGAPSDSAAPTDDVGDDASNDNADVGPPNARLAVFDDPDSDFTTTDVHDVDDEIVQFDRETQAIIWAADGMSFDPGVWTIDGNLLAGGWFQVRFGSKDGTRRAYFIETGAGTICDISIFGNQLGISPTNVQVPQE